MRQQPPQQGRIADRGVEQQRQEQMHQRGDASRIGEEHGRTFGCGPRRVNARKDGR